MTNSLGPRSGAAKVRILSPAFLERRWKPGESGNPAGHTAEYGEVIKLARDLSLRAVERLGELVESDDERVAAVAANAILDRAFGKPQPRFPENDDPLARLKNMSEEQRAAEAVALMRRFKQRLREAEERAEFSEAEFADGEDG
jgi:hypothetical protein